MGLFCYANCFSNEFSLKKMLRFYCVFRALKERTSSLTSHFWPTVMVLSIKNGFYKTKKSIFRLNYARYEQNIRKWNCFRTNNARYEKMLKSKIVHLEEIYNFYFDHFLIKRTTFVLIVKNVIKNQKFNFPDKLCDIWKNVTEQNCSFQKDLQIWF